MRSFIKSHRKSGSSTSDLIEYPSPCLEYPQPQTLLNRNNSNTTPIPSPKIANIPEYTPPPISVTNGSSLSSPKKLLTPIKNLFSSHHHSKSLTNTPSANDSLQNIINGSTPKYTDSKHRFRGSKKLSKKQSPTQLLDPPYSDEASDLEQPFKPSFRKVTSSPSLHIFYPPNTRPPPKIIRTQNRVSQYDGLSINSPYLPDIPHDNDEINDSHELGLGPPISLSKSGSFNTSDTSMAESHDNFQTKKVVFDESVLEIKHDETETDDPRTYSESNGVEEDEEEDEDDSSSSQFSFVQDMKGGRNTSVKYYKNKVAATNDNVQSNTFDEHDLGYEVDEYSDYDFENNGMDYEEGDDDVQYNKLFADDEEKPTNYPEPYVHNKAIDAVSYSRSTSSGYSSGVVPIFEPKNDSLTPIHIDSSIDNLHLDSKEDTHRLFNESYHLSIQGPIEGAISELSYHDEDEDFNKEYEHDEEDLLENYLEAKVTPESINVRTPPPEIRSDENLELFDLHSPMITGLTVGYRLRPNRRRNNDVNTNRLCIHRHPIAVNQVINSSELVSGGSVSDVVGNRYWHSFHSSLDENLHLEIGKKVKDFEDFSESLEQSQEVDKTVPEMVPETVPETIPESVPETSTIGLGITTEENETIVHGVMELLNNLENVNEKPKPSSEPAKQMRNSVLGMMDILSSLEKKQGEIEKESVKEEVQEKAKQNRQSIVDMMATLSQIETVTNNNGQAQEIVRRNSINDMMNTLANLDLLNGNSFIKENKKELVPEEHEIKTSSKTPLHCSTTPVIKEYWTDKDTSMDQDLLDEINQLPEDFEFEDHESKRPSSSPAFFRSNSYNKKPSKSVMSNQYQSNKIETTNKTVTFYRNSYSAPSLEIKKTDSISRTPSARSYNSCTSVREEENSDEEDIYDAPKMRFYSQFMINDLHSNDSFSRQNNLKTISEGESPFLR